MTRLTARELERALKAEGVTVVKVAMQGRAWPNNVTNGGFNPHGIMNHHDASHKRTRIWDAVRVIWVGRSDLDGPLAHISLGRDAKAYLVGWDNCNHAGNGDNDVLRAVLRDVPAPKPTRDEVDGNPNFWAIEVQNDGVGEPYSLEQLNTLIKINAAICRASGWKATSCIHHKEWTRRKVDMSWNGDLRKHVADCLAQPAGQWHYPGLAVKSNGKPVPRPDFTGGPNVIGALKYVGRGLNYATSAKKPYQKARWEKIRKLLLEF